MPGSPDGLDADASNSAADALVAAEQAKKEAADRQAAHDEALQRALQAEEEAAAATRDRDAAAQHARAALTRAAKERAAAAATLAPAPGDEAPEAAPPPDLRAAMLLHEAVALL
jgi:hypothetical protein